MTDQNGASHSSSNAPLDPRKDPAIFRPDGTIVFPRSDGDPDYKAPHTVSPGPTDQEVNYFYVMQPGDHKYERWALLSGADLAQWAGQPAKPPAGKEWKLAGYPADYQMTEQRKGPRDSYRTDQYLYGSAGHRFRSTKEFLPHAQWLIANDGSPCECKYCPGGRPRGGGGGSEHLPRDRKERPARLPRPPLSNKKMAPSNSYKVRTQELPQPQERPHLGVTVPSVPLRDIELARTAAAKKGECEGYRVGEVVWVTLEPPFEDPNESKTLIDKWPAQIEDVKVLTIVAPQAQTPAPPYEAGQSEASNGDGGNQAEDSFSLRGRVHQERHYDVILIGSPQDQGRLHESRIQPFLSGFVNEGVSRSSFGKMEDHTWMDSDVGFPSKLHLLEPAPAGAQKPSFSQLVASLAFSMMSCNYLRCRYRPTDRFFLPEGLESSPGAEESVLDGGMNGDGDASLLEDASAESRTRQSELPTSTQQGVDETDGGPSVVKRGIFRSKSRTVYKGATYYQGIFGGLERIWVGDVVRLKLTQREVKDMMEALSSEKSLARRTDAGEGADCKGTYIMRVRAFVEEGRSVKAAGSVYQVMTQSEFDSKKAAEKGVFDASSQKEDNDLDPQEQFAFPALSFLTAHGQELPASPHAPQGFLLSRVNIESREVVLDVTKVAGRFYPSLSKPDDHEQTYSMKYVQKLLLNKYYDTNDANLARLSLIGGLPGLIKSMNMEARERGTGAEFMKSCFDVARGEVREVTRLSIEGSMPSSAAMGQLTQQAQETIQAVAAAAAAFANNNEGEDSVGKRKATSNDVSSSPSGPERKRAAAESSTNGKTPVRGATMVTSSSSPSVSVVTPTLTRTSQGLANREVVVEDPNLPPLREGWIAQKSRNGHGIYYAHLATKTTSWERPT